jgi:cytochrome bd-type quinol oxidase subunit 2
MLIISIVKKLSVFASGLLAYLSLPLVAFAVVDQGNINPCVGTTTGLSGVLCNLSNNNIGLTIRNIVVFLIIIAVIIALVYLIYGGIKWITSKGEKTEVEAARNHIMAAILGLVVVFLTLFILTIVLTAFGIKWTDLTIPNISGTTTTTTATN